MQLGEERSTCSASPKRQTLAKAQAKTRLRNYATALRRIWEQRRRDARSSGDIAHKLSHTEPSNIRRLTGIEHTRTSRDESRRGRTETRIARPSTFNPRRGAAAAAQTTAATSMPRDSPESLGEAANALTMRRTVCRGCDTFAFAAHQPAGKCGTSRGGIVVVFRIMKI